MRFPPIRAGLLVCVFALFAAAQQQLTVAKLIEFINSSIQQKMQDKEVAGFLSSVRLSEKLDARTVEDLQGRGAGPRTVAALNRLAEASASLPVPAPKVAPPKYVPPPPPPVEEQNRILNEVREYALNYSTSLPDFICLQLTHRYMDRHYKPGDPGSWSPLDRLSEKLSYFDQHEKYEPLSHNDSSLFGKDYDHLGGSMSRGEFGTLLREIFDPESHAEFHWERWTTLRGNLCHVYTYRIEQPYSKESIDYNRQQQVTPGYHGEIFVKDKDNVILRVTVDPEPPPGFPVQNIHQVLDYKYADISGQQFLLPMYSEVIMRADGVGTKNEIDFRSYRKYSADATITFSDADEAPTSEDQKKETPPAPKPPPM